MPSLHLTDTEIRIQLAGKYFLIGGFLFGSPEPYSSWASRGCDPGLEDGKNSPLYIDIRKMICGCVDNITTNRYTSH